MLDASTIQAMYAGMNDGDFDVASQWMSENVVHHLPGLGMEMSGREQAVRALRQMYADLGVQQHVLRTEFFGPFVVLFVEASSVLRPRLEGVHVLRLDDDGRIAEFWGITTPMPGVPAPA